MSELKVYRVRETRAPHRTWDCLAKDMAHAKAQVLANEPRLRAVDLGASVPGGDARYRVGGSRLTRPMFPEDDE
jgi:hypothetical protein